jgi:nicotinamide-nucleotide amidase
MFQSIMAEVLGSQSEAMVMATEPLEFVIGRVLLERRLTLALAESCTGGLIGDRVTNVPGSSAYFLGGVVSYSYDAKERLLGVSHDTLYDFGAVSEPTAREMARGARRALGADIGVAVTGIAGPGGAMPGKPVGLTWIALSARDAEQAWQFTWQGSRTENKAQSAEAALALLSEYLHSRAA